MVFGLHPNESRSGRSDTYPWIMWVWDVDRDVWTTDWDPNTDFMLGGALAATTGDGPGAPPSSPSASSVGTGGFTAGWTNGDAAALTEYWERDVTLGEAFVAVDTAIAAGTASKVRASLASGHEYEWKVRHRKNGIWSEFASTVSTNGTWTLDLPSAGAAALLRIT